MNGDRSFTKEKAILLRQKGYSLQEIATELDISKSTASLWLKYIHMNNQAKARLKSRQKEAVTRAINTRIERRQIYKDKVIQKARSILSEINITVHISKLLCSIFLWTEGGEKTGPCVYFMNSNPLLVGTFIKLFRLSYNPDESKFRALVHIHNYHNDPEIKLFWSKITNIPLSQFNKSYLKQNTSKRIRENYMGCIRIAYYDSKIALELRMIYNMFAQHLLIDKGV